VNTSASWPSAAEAVVRVQEIQTKLHQWAKHDPNRRFDDLYNLVCDPSLLLIAWRRVKVNRGARSAGVDAQTAYSIRAAIGEERFLAELRADLKARTFRPMPVRERMIPKRGGKLRRLGIATIRDRVVQAAVKLVLEPIFEVDFQPCSYGFWPGRRAQEAIYHEIAQKLRAGEGARSAVHRAGEDASAAPRTPHRGRGSPAGRPTPAEARPITLIM